MGTTTRGFPWPEGTAAADGPGAFQDLAEAIDAEFDGLDVGGYSEGTLGDRPAAGQAGRIYRVSLGTGLGRIYVDTGAAWVEFGSIVSAIQASGSITAATVTATGVISGGSMSSSGSIAGSGLVSSATGLGLPAFATSSLPTAGPVGMLVYDTTTAQLKVKTASGTAAYAAVGGSSAATGTAQIPSVYLYSTDVTVAVFVGTGFSELFVEFSAASGQSNLGFSFQLTSDPTQGFGVVVTNGSSVLVMPASSAEKYSVPFLDNNGTTRTMNVSNMRLDSDGYLRFSASAAGYNTGTTAGLNRFRWRAR